MDQYKPVDCGFYDRLETAATLKKTVEISYLSEGQTLTATAVIKDLKSVNGAEFAVLSDGTLIRLDRILSVDGNSSAGSCAL